MEIQVPSLLRIKPKAMHKLGKYLSKEGFRNVAIFWGEGIKDMFNPVVEISLASASVNTVFENIVLDNNIDTAFEAGKNLPFNVDAVVAIGGGKAVDFCKYVAFSKQLPLMAIPTLISNDAFASPSSSLTVNGRRKTVKTVVPHGVIIDTEVVRSAPKHFLYSGIGDIIGKTTAVFDWKLSYKKCGETVNDFASTVSLNAVDTFTFYENKDLENLEYIGVIASSLLMTGIAMIIAGGSRPASGSEHLISHAYDAVAEKPSLHGLQVGVAAYGVSAIQKTTHERLKKDIINSGFYDFMRDNPLNREDFIKAVMNAVNVKENFCTILSERGSVEELLKFIDEDDMMKNMLI